MRVWGVCVPYYTCTGKAVGGFSDWLSLEVKGDAKPLNTGTKRR